MSPCIAVYEMITAVRFGRAVKIRRIGEEVKPLSDWGIDSDPVQGKILISRCVNLRLVSMCILSTRSAYFGEVPSVKNPLALASDDLRASIRRVGLPKICLLVS